MEYTYIYTIKLSEIKSVNTNVDRALKKLLLSLSKVQLNSWVQESTGALKRLS